MLNKKFILSFIFALLFFSSAFARIKKTYSNLTIRETSFKKLKGWEKDRCDLAVNAFIKSCDEFALLSDSKEIGAGIVNIRVRDLRNVCDIAKVIDGMGTRHARKFFEDWFVPFEIFNNTKRNSGLFKGYYEVKLYGRRQKSDKYKYPIYARPMDLDNENPYYTREEIENGILDEKKLTLFYVDNKVDLFFLHLRGSGKVILENDVVKRIVLTATNNHPYTAIDQIMIDRKILRPKEVSMGAIKEWLRNNPSQADEIMNKNTSYSFFAESKDDYIRGEQGAVLTPERSLAVDDSIIPLGFPMWIETSLPIETKGRVAYNRLLVSQDTNSEIKGAVRGDVFFGFGERAEELASYMQERGKYYILLPINVVEKMAKN
jgi:membrane-bound lytic murein transglycosylase A